MAFSVTKSFFGTIAATLVAEGKLDERAPVSRYIPELAAAASAMQRSRQVLDMTTAVDFSENYVDSNSNIVATASRRLAPSQVGGGPPKSIYTFLATIVKEWPAWRRFTYRSPNTDVVGWLVARPRENRSMQC